MSDTVAGKTIHDVALSDLVVESTAASMEKLAQFIDDAGDSRCESALRVALEAVDALRQRKPSPKDEALLLYFAGNAWSDLQRIRNADGTVQGTLIGTNLKTFRGKVTPAIGKPLREFTMKDRRMNFELPNTQPWTFAGELSADGRSLTGTLNSAQGGMPVTFRKQ